MCLICILWLTHIAPSYIDYVLLQMKGGNSKMNAFKLEFSLIGIRIAYLIILSLF